MVQRYDPWTDCKNSNFFIRHIRISALSDCLAISLLKFEIYTIWIKRNKIDWKFRCRFMYRHKWKCLKVSLYFDALNCDTRYIIFSPIISMRENWSKFQCIFIFIHFLWYNLIQWKYLKVSSYLFIDALNCDTRYITFSPIICMKIDRNFNVSLFLSKLEKFLLV